MGPGSSRTMLPIVCLAVGAWLGVCPVWAEHGFVLVQVQDTQHRPVRGVEIGIEGLGGSKLTGDDGKAKLSIGTAAKEGDWISLAVLHSPPGKDLAMISPWDSRSPIPSFEEKPENFVRVVVVQRGDLTALADGTVLASLAEKINKANAPKSAKEPSGPEDAKVNLDAVAKQYGLSADHVDKAIRAWGANTTDPYEAGLAALYERNYPKASAQLEDSLKQREAKLAEDTTRDQNQVADAAFFLGQSLLEQGKYRESARAFERCLQIRPDDPAVLNDTAVSLELAGDYTRAEPLYRRALAINETALGPDNSEVATNLGNLGLLFEFKGNYAEGEPLLRRALAIDEGVLGPNHPNVARDLNNLAELLMDKSDYAEAEPLHRRALAINEKALGSEHPSVATDLNNLAELLRDKGDFAGAEPLYRRALAIDEKALGPDHPDVARDLNNLAELLRDKGEYAEAEPLYRRALAVNEKALGSEHPSVATDLNNLAVIARGQGRLRGSRAVVPPGAGDR